ncbi:hypothetical protein KSS87_005913 [Heliosperma pusillum]|nr:hypothetical protein KSS87_005913 [Heliosperma pusillum]
MGERKRRKTRLEAKGATRGVASCNRGHIWEVVVGGLGYVVARRGEILCSRGCSVATTEKLTIGRPSVLVPTMLGIRVRVKQGSCHRGPVLSASNNRNTGRPKKKKKKKKKKRRRFKPSHCSQYPLLSRFYLGNLCNGNYNKLDTVATIFALVHLGNILFFRWVKSQGSISSTQALNTHASVSSSDPPSEFVNLGLNHWNQTRQHWVSSKKETSKGQQTRDPKSSNRRFSVLDSVWPFSWKATNYESLLGSNKPFSQPVPLAEMVDFLVDVWEQEGMYD